MQGIIWRYKMTSRLPLRSTISHLSVLQILSKQEYCEVIIMIGNEDNNHGENLTPDSIRNNLYLTKRECDSMMGVLMSLEIVNMIDNQYCLTILGKEVYESINLIETAIKMHRVLDTTNILELLER